MSTTFYIAAQPIFTLSKKNDKIVYKPNYFLKIIYDVSAIYDD